MRRYTSGQFAIPGVSLQFVGGHTLVNVMQADLLATVNPLARRIDFGIRLDGRDNSRGRDFDLSSFLDDPFEGCTNVPLSLREKPEGVRTSTGIY